MNESKAIKIIKQEMGWESKSSTLRAFEEAIKALEEVQQYRAISTTEECRAAMQYAHRYLRHWSEQICQNCVLQSGCRICR